MRQATQTLHAMGQSLWLDNITRGLLTSGTLRRYIQDYSVTGLTSNPTIFDHAIKNSHDYDDAIRQKVPEGKSGEALFFELALEDLRQAADLFRPIHDQTNSGDGWVSLEVSPLLAHDTAGTITAAKALHARAGRPNLFIKMPGTTINLFGNNSNMQQLSIVGKDYHTEEHVVGYYTTGDRMKYWGQMGAFWGGLWGFLLGAAFFFVPGIGPLVVAGPLVSWIVGALEGAALMGGLSALGAGLYSIGIPRDSILQYEAALKADNFLVIAHGTAEEVARAKNIIDTTGAVEAAVHSA